MMKHFVTLGKVGRRLAKILGMSELIDNERAALRATMATAPIDLDKFLDWIFAQSDGVLDNLTVKEAVELYLDEMRLGCKATIEPLHHRYDARSALTDKREGD